jgi:hypothetical protein
MNYDFKANWDDIILPLLGLPVVKKSIKKGITNFINDGNCGEDIEYNSKICPASYGRDDDDWDTYINEYEEKLVEKLLKTGILKKDDNQPLNEDDLDEYFNESDNFIKYTNYKNQIIEPFIQYHENTCLRSYQMKGACHWWNPTFSLTLAKLVYPNEKWRVKKGFHHTTVVNSNETLVFDILYFDENEEMKGGALALYESSKKE